MTYTTIYDSMIMRAWTIPLDWRWGKAQLIAESDLDPKATSPVGARGLAQFMDDTWGDVCKHFGWPPEASPYDPTYAIPAFAWYMEAQCWDKWTMKRPVLDRLHLAQASYNAGLGNIVKAQQWAQMAPDYLSIIAKLDAVTGMQNAEQTRNYVTRIGAIYLQLTEENA